MLIQAVRFSLFSLIFFLIACNAYISPVKGVYVSRYCQFKTENEINQLQCKLAQAQQKKDQSEIDKISVQSIKLLGNQAGVPEKSEQFIKVDPQSRKLTSPEVSTAFIPYGQKIQKYAWWLSQPTSTELKTPLRAIASVITGVLAAREAGSEYSDHLLKIAQNAGDYIVWVQQQADRGVFPLPDMRGKEGRIPSLMTEFLAQAEKNQQISQVISNGWIVEDLGGGDLQFDNGVCGVALLELYEATQDQKYLQSALKAADWAINQPVVPNWNYNSFSIFLLANAYRITGNEKYLNSAKEKARLGLYPGQLQTGTHKGRWLDPHNARLAYHYIMIRGLGSLVAVLPANDPDLPIATKHLSLALQAANKEILANGISEADYILEVLSRLKLTLPPESGRLADEHRSSVLDLVGRYASSQFLSGKLPVSPGAWGLYLRTMKK
jgi:hypothetical protein